MNWMWMAGLFLWLMAIAFSGGGCCGPGMHHRAATNVFGEIAVPAEEFIEVLGEFRSERERWPADPGELTAFAHARGHYAWQATDSVAFDTYDDETFVMTIRRGRRGPRPEDRTALRWENGSFTIVPVPRG